MKNDKHEEYYYMYLNNIIQLNAHVTRVEKFWLNQCILSTKPQITMTMNLFSKSMYT